MPSPPLAVYVRLWAAAQLLEWSHGSLAWGRPFDLLQALLCALALLLPSLAPLSAAAHAARAINPLTKAPRAWDSEYLGMLSDGGVLVSLLRGGGVEAERELSRHMRWQLFIFYTAAGLWKLNSSFLDPRYSCATVYLLQLLDAHLPTSLASSLALPISRLAPPLTIVLEMAIGLFFVLSPRIAGVLGVLLHTGIALTPPPNNISAFGIVCTLRYFWVAPEGGVRAWEEVGGVWGGIHLACGAALLGATLRGPSPAFDWPAAAYGVLASFMLRAIALQPPKTNPSPPIPAYPRHTGASHQRSPLGSILERGGGKRSRPLLHAPAPGRGFLHQVHPAALRAPPAAARDKGTRRSFLNRLYPHRNTRRRAVAAEFEG
ncbi:MAG: hypothetical protein SGPRY_013767 [Prymnesium sp.]